MAKTKQNLESEIDDQIKENGNAEITGPVLNTVLRSMTDTLFGSTFLYPADVSLDVNNDIGKLLMNDGSGTAKVYQLSPATTEQLGRFVLRLEDLNDLNNSSAIEIDGLNTDEYFDRPTWRNGNTPTTPLEELELIQDYIDGNTNLAHLTTSIVDDELVLEENTFDSTRFKMKDFPFGALFVDTVSRPALPAAPTAFPLGKLCGIDGSNAIVSCNSTETYLLEGSFSVNNGLFNYETDIDFETVESVADVATHIIIPASDGKVKPINLNDFSFDESFLKSFRHHFVGLAIASTANTVTVIGMTYVSFIAGFAFRLFQRGFIGNIKD